jgi:hypothetical protein
VTSPDDVSQLLAELKALPLIESADLDKPFAAYDAFELVVSAILRAALVQVPESGRKGKNRELFERFVVNHFPLNRGRDDGSYAKRLWDFRCAVVKEKTTGSFVLIHNTPGMHLPSAGVLNLEGLIADFQEAVDSLGAGLRKSPEMRQVAAIEIQRRQVTIGSPETLAHSSSVGRSVTIANLSASAASGTRFPGARRRQ